MGEVFTSLLNLQNITERIPTSTAAAHRVGDRHRGDARKGSLGGRVSQQPTATARATTSAISAGQKLPKESRLLLVQLRCLLRQITGVLVRLWIALAGVEALLWHTLGLKLLFDILAELHPLIG